MFINPYNVGATGNSLYTNGAKDEAKKNGEGNPQVSLNDKKQYSSAEVLGFMAAKNLDVIPKNTSKTINVSDYVSSEQAAGIKNMMADFEEKYNTTLNAVLAEFPELTEDAANEIALATMNAQN